MTQLIQTIQGQSVPPPKEWRGIQVLATFDNSRENGVGSIQPNISTEQFTYVNEAAVLIRQYIEDGLTNGVGIFEGIPTTLQLTNGTSIDIFEGFIDLADNFVEDSPVQVQARIVKENGLNSLFERSEANTFGFLFDQGVITQSDFVDIDYVVEKEINFVELAVLGLTLYALNKELAESIRRTVGYITEFVGVAASATPPSTGILGAIILLAARLILETIYSIIIITQLVNLTKELIQQFISPIRQHKGMRLETMFTKAFGHLGYGFQTGIADMDWVYLPSKPADGDPVATGIPRTSDFGYVVSEMIELARRLFDSREAVIPKPSGGSDVHIRSDNDPFWIQTSTFVLPDTLRGTEQKRYNTDQFNANTLIRFETDPLDGWTIRNFTGTNVQAIRTAATVNNIDHQLLKGLDEVEIPLALGNRKDGLNELEKAVKAVASIADGLINFFGGNSDLAGDIQNRVGMLKTTQNAHNVPKLLKIVNDRIPANHRDNLSAEQLYTNYHSHKSFVLNNFVGQKRVFTGIKIPFGLTDFNALINNSYFTTQSGQIGKVVSLKWTFDGDFAEVDYWIREPYTKNLKEVLITP